MNEGGRMRKIVQLATEFRKAIDSAFEAGEFDCDIIFRSFPQGCCGDASDLLAQYLLENGIKTTYICGTYWGEAAENRQSHAWLITGRYIIIDITGDQFKRSHVFLNYDKSVYVGKEDKFHRLFEVEDRNVYECHGIDALGSACRSRLWDLYKKIVKYI